MKKLLLAVSCLYCLWFFLSAPVLAAAQPSEFRTLNDGWQYHLGDLPQSTRTPAFLSQKNSNHKWVDIPDLAKPAQIPKNVNIVWYRVKLPRGEWKIPCLYFELFYAQSLSVFYKSALVHEEQRYWERYENKIMIPLDQKCRNETLFIRAYSKNVNFGPRPNVYIGNHHELLIKFYQDGLINIILGFAIAFLATVMFFCSFFLNRAQQKSWISISLIIFILGTGEAVYPNKLGTYFQFFDQYSRELADLLKYTFFPLLTYFFEQILGPGRRFFIRRLWQMQSIFGLFCLSLMVLNYNVKLGINPFYNIVSEYVIGVFCIIQYIVLISLAMYYSLKKNPDAIIFNIGFSVFALIACSDVVRFIFFTTENPFSFWKWGLLAFVISLICILGRRVASNYYQVITYSTELEIKNLELDSMWREIKTSRDQLADLNKTLEKKVAERTEQLAETNRELSCVNEELSATNHELIETMDILKKTQDQLIESEKLAALGQLITGITHEINTPFGAIRASLGLITESLNNILINFLPFFQKLSREIQDDFLLLLHTASSSETEMMTSREERQLRKSLLKQLQEYNLENSEEYADMLSTAGIKDIHPHQAIMKHPEHVLILKMLYTISGLKRNLKTIAIAAERTSKVVYALKSYTYHSCAAEMVQVDVIQGIETILTLYQNKTKNNVKVVCNYREVPPIWCYPDELNQVWTNIIDNALYAMKYQGTLTIDVSSTAEYIYICFSDSGPGIPIELREKIFNPFFTTKPPGEGSGMGLDIVRRIIEKHHGIIKLDSIPGKTTFNFYIPLSQVHLDD